MQILSSVEPEPARILVVEDERLVARDLMLTLRKLGYRADRTAHTGEQALELAAKDRPELALMDISLGGGMDGIDTALELFSRYQIPVVFLTALSDDGTLSRAAGANALGYLIKPFSDNEIKGAIGIALQKGRSDRSLRLRHAALEAEHQDLHAAATRDELTGLFNRREFNRLFAAECHRSKRHHHPASLLFIDLDDFKRVNDSLGHAVGDQVLAAAGARIRTSLRLSDWAARFGGEEFVVVLPETTAPGARDVAERIRRAISDMQVAALPLTSPPTFVSITVSIGVAELGVDAADGTGLVQAADAALYVAKERGKNRVESYRAAGTKAHPETSTLRLVRDS